MKRGKGTSSQYTAASAKDLERENRLAAQKLDLLKKHLSSEREKAERDALRAESLSNFGADIVSLDPRKPKRPRGTLPSFPRDATTDLSGTADVPVKAKKQPAAKPKKVRLTYLKDEPIQPRQRSNDTPLSEKLKEIQLGRHDNIAALNGTVKMGVSSAMHCSPSVAPRVSASTGIGVGTADPRPVCGQCETAGACQNCLDCKELYCSACFTRFHHKGALRSHVSETIMATSCPGVFSKKTRASTSSQSSQQGSVTAEGVGTSEQAANFSTDSLLNGKYDEQAQAQSFQEAVRAWREGREPADTPTATSTTTTTTTTTATVTNTASTALDRDGNTRPRSQRGGALWGEYDEEASAEGFARAVQEWREGHMATPKASTMSASVAPPEPVSTGTSSHDLQPGMPSAAQLNLDFGKSQLSYTERLMLQKHKEGKLLSDLAAEQPLSRTTSRVSDDVTGQFDDVTGQCDDVTGQFDSSVSSDTQQSDSSVRTVAEPARNASPHLQDTFARSEADALDLLPAGSRPVSVHSHSHRAPRSSVPLFQHSAASARPADRASSRQQTDSGVLQREVVSVCSLLEDGQAPQPNKSNTENYRPLYNFLIDDTGDAQDTALSVSEPDGEPDMEPQIESVGFHLGSKAVWIPDYVDEQPSTAHAITCSAATSNGADHICESHQNELRHQLSDTNVATDQVGIDGIDANGSVTPTASTHAETDQLQFNEGDLEVIDFDDAGLADSDHDDERCLTELARELATAHGWRDIDLGKQDDEEADENATDQLDSCAEREARFAALESQTQLCIDADMEALRAESEAAGDVL
ncbi:platelet binding protein GspB-like isoform X2 [Sycon ciliatum]|uniref:platelet binding protein GspB-like isoform X2 n=1 Tax=Sycon ciliatum TaxID=27933 RepID=UPI0031F633DE